MRLLLAVLAASIGFAAPTLADPSGPALGAALASGQIDASTFDFGALRYAPGRTLSFLAAETGAQAAIAKAHGKANWPALLAAKACLTPEESLTIAGFESALVAPDPSSWARQKAAADAAYGRYGAARDAILNGQPSPYPEFQADEAAIAAAARAGRPELTALYRHETEARIWRHALVFGRPKAYAEDVGTAGAVWLNARLTDEGCAVDAAAAAWLMTTLNSIVWFDIRTYGRDADKAAWAIALHADSAPDLQRLALERMGTAVVDHQSDAANFAYLWDRVALNTGRPQRYGTQMRCVAGAWTPLSPIEDLTKLDERRRNAGLAAEGLFEKAGAKVCGGG